MAPGTVIEVDSEHFYFASSGCAVVSNRLSVGFQGVVSTLAGCDSMGGSDDGGEVWGRDYDEQVRATLTAVNELIQAFDNHALLLMQAGRNHDTAEHGATLDAGPPPSLPPDPDSAALVTPTNPASAVGNAGGGLEAFDELIESIGIPCPNGDTTKLATAANAWDEVAQLIIDDAAATVSQFIDDLRNVRSPEVDLAIADCEALSHLLGETGSTVRGLAQSCRDHASSIEETRFGIVPVLEGLMTDLGLTVAVTVLAALVSAGTSAVVGAANASRLIKTAADMIRPIVRIFVDKTPRLLARERVGDAPSRIRSVAERLRGKSKEEADGASPRPPETAKPWTAEDQAAFDFATRSERLEHTFHPKHNFDPLVEQFGSREAVVRAFLEELNGLTPAAGVFEETIVVGGQNVVVRGAVHDGVVKIGTAFTP
ncbi:hypothetical protein ABIC28_004340 [Rhodococcus sp. PvR044]|uniref:hypothetical protein n=1 Tax=Rhodococcus sp. PvR044 TaxID=3156402 RepID=UPI0033931A58